MGIDGIGRSGAPPPGVGGAEGAGGVDKEFSVGSKDAVEGAGVDGVRGDAPLDKLDSGELSLDQYLDAQVGEATQHLQAHVSPARLQEIQSVLRAELATDPALVEWVARATGRKQAV